MRSSLSDSSSSSPSAAAPPPDAAGRSSSFQQYGNLHDVEFTSLVPECEPHRPGLCTCGTFVIDGPLRDSSDLTNAAQANPTHATILVRKQVQASKTLIDILALRRHQSMSVREVDRTDKTMPADIGTEDDLDQSRTRRQLESLLNHKSNPHSDTQTKTHWSLELEFADGKFASVQDRLQRGLGDLGACARFYLGHPDCPDRLTRVCGVQVDHGAALMGTYIGTSLHGDTLEFVVETLRELGFDHSDEN